MPAPMDIDFDGSTISAANRRALREAYERELSASTHRIEVAEARIELLSSGRPMADLKLEVMHLELSIRESRRFEGEITDICNMLLWRMDSEDLTRRYMESRQRLRNLELGWKDEVNELRESSETLRCERAASAAKRNALLPISLVPNEILLDIFHLGVSQNDPLSTRLPFEVAVSGVMRHWRRTALRAPFLWSRIRPYNCQRYDMLQAYLKRSKSAPLDIILGPSNVDIPLVGSLLLKHSSHWHRLVITFSPSFHSYLYENEVFVRQAKTGNLNDLFISVSGGMKPMFCPLFILSLGRSPNLSNLVVTRAAVDFYSDQPVEAVTLLRLRSIALEVYMEQYLDGSLRYFFDHLCAPTLTRLVLDFSAQGTSNTMLDIGRFIPMKNPRVDGSSLYPSLKILDIRGYAVTKDLLLDFIEGFSLVECVVIPRHRITTLDDALQHARGSSSLAPWPYMRQLIIRETVIEGLVPDMDWWLNLAVMAHALRDDRSRRSFFCVVFRGVEPDYRDIIENQVDMCGLRQHARVDVEQHNVS